MREPAAAAGINAMDDPEIEITADDRPLFHAQKRSARSTWPMVLVVIFAAAAGGGYYFWSLRHEAAPTTPPAPAAETRRAPQPSQASTAPPIEHPLENASPPVEPLPALTESDVAAGKPSDSTRLRVLINQATGIAPAKAKKPAAKVP